MEYRRTRSVWSFIQIAQSPGGQDTAPTPKRFEILGIWTAEAAVWRTVNCLRVYMILRLPGQSR